MQSQLPNAFVIPSYQDESCASGEAMTTKGQWSFEMAIEPNWIAT